MERLEGPGSQRVLDGSREVSEEEPMSEDSSPSEFATKGWTKGLPFRSE